MDRLRDYLRGIGVLLSDMTICLLLLSIGGAFTDIRQMDVFLIGWIPALLVQFLVKAVAQLTDVFRGSIFNTVVSGCGDVVESALFFNGNNKSFQIKRIEETPEVQTVQGTFRRIKKAYGI